MTICFILKNIIGGEIEMAEFYAYRIIAGKTTFAKVPAKLKPDVRAILIDEGYGHLADE